MRTSQHAGVARIILSWAFDGSFTRIAQWAIPSHFVDVVEDTGSNLASNVSFIETLARASLETYLSPWFPRR